MVNIIKNIAIIVDFVVSFVAAAIKDINPVLSNALFGASAIILLVAVICVVIDIIKSRTDK